MLQDSATMVRVRPAGPGDVEAIREVSLAAGHGRVDSGADPSYVRLLGETGSVVVAEAGGVVVGWGAVHHGRLGTLLSDLFVLAHRHGEGIGKALLEALWPPAGEPAGEHTPEQSTGRYTFSSQHPYALPLYLRSGLVATWPLLYLQGRAPADRADGLSTRAVEASEAADAEAGLLERRGLGGRTRHEEYEYWTEQEGSAALLVLGEDGLVAAGAVRRGQLVHLVCGDEERAAAATTAAVQMAGGDEVELCVPAPHPAVGALLSAGFRLTTYDIAAATPGTDLPATWVYAPGLS